MNLNDLPKRIMLYFVYLNTIFTIAIGTSCGTKDASENNLGSTLDPDNFPIKEAPAPKFDFNNEDLVKFINDFIASGGVKTPKKITIALLDEAQKKNPAISQTRLGKELIKIIEAEEAKIIGTDTKKLIEELDLIANPNKYSVGGGLRNIGNTCFMNATLQALIRIGGILDVNRPIGYRQEHSKEQYSDEEKEEVNKLKEAYKRISKNIKAEAPVKTEDLEIIRSAIRELRNYEFADYDQADAAALLNLLIDFTGSKNVQFEETITTTCSKGHVSIKTEKNNMLIIPCKDEMQDSINSTFNEEELDDKNPYECEKCKLKVKAKRRINIKTAPILIVQYKRFTQHERLDNTVKNINDITVTTENGKKKIINNYKLKSIISQTGSLNEGHYWSEVVDPSGQWHEYNDSFVSPIVNTGDSENGYIFIYEKTK